MHKGYSIFAFGIGGSLDTSPFDARIKGFKNKH